MNWCEKNRVDYLFGIARNQRLVDHIATQLIFAAGADMASASSKAPSSAGQRLDPARLPRKMSRMVLPLCPRPTGCLAGSVIDDQSGRL